MDHLILIHPDMRARTKLQQALREEFNIEAYGDANRALAAHKHNPADLFIVVLENNSASLLHVVRALRTNKTFFPIICAGPANNQDEEIAFRLGADDYLRVPFSVQILNERIKALLRRVHMKPASLTGTFRKKSDKDSVYNFGDLEIIPEKHQVTWKGHDIDLTASEFKMLSELARNPGILKDRNRLMDVAFEHGVYINDRTVDSYIKRIRQKFVEADQNFRAIETVYGRGYRFSEQAKSPSPKP